MIFKPRVLAGRDTVQYSGLKNQTSGTYFFLNLSVVSSMLGDFLKFEAGGKENIKR